ncbi:helix-turn-helix transcriptional regulator [Bradyrhizobium brasilense]|uniref:AlpA family phage regulatory protein n=1 Tax=Bradyrhizobium brasilense TaxID=1419277 RepID=A0ABY8JGX7_9BRAD|nr:AlpA family phage regulatory protein [Bradyrhizobium brasilense]WFU64840.1 AlpA family phage regulatory protein [Bradyrhizobium brasilense]
MAERFISVKQVLDRVCLSKSVVYDRIRAGTFPRTIRLGQNKAVFLESEIDAWMLAQRDASENGSKRSRNAVASRRDRKASA